MTKPGSKPSKQTRASSSLESLGGNSQWATGDNDGLPSVAEYDPHVDIKGNMLYRGRRARWNDAGVSAGARRNRGPGAGETRRLPARFPRRYRSSLNT